MIQDLRWGIRQLRGSAGLTLTATVSLAFGIAANTIVFGWIDDLLIRPIPGATRATDLATIETVSPSGAVQNTAYRDFRDYRDQLRQISGATASLANVFTVGSEQTPRLLWGEFVSGDYFSVLGAQPIRGRAFFPSESGDSAGGPPVVIISDRLWQSAFNRDPAVIGKTLRVNQRMLTVVGVVAPEFRGTVPGLVLEMWIPMSLAPELNGQGTWLLENRDERQMWITARLRDGVTMEQARAEVIACARRMAQSHPNTNRGFSATLVPVWRGHLGAHSLLRTPLQILMAVSLLLFLIVAANVANLQLVRLASRRKEFSLRVALGAGAGRLVRQLLTESLLLSVAGALGGAVLALWGREALVWLLPPTNIPIAVTSKMSWHVLAFLIVLCAAATVLTGVAPSLHSLRTRVSERLKENSRGTTSSAGSRRTRSLLVASEVALATVAIAGTGALLRDFQKTSTLDPGMDTRHVACAKYYVETFCKTREERQQFCRHMADRLRGAPGVIAVSYSDFVPLEFGEGSDATVTVEGYAPAPGEDMRVGNNSVSPEFFATLGIPFIEGRDFREPDDAGAARVMIVNQAFARRFFANGPVVGRKVRVDGSWFTVIGLVRDIKLRSLTEPPIPHFFRAARQMSGGEFWTAFFVKTQGPVSPALAGLGREAAAVNAATRSSGFLEYRRWIEVALYPQRVAATLVAVVGAICLLLAAIGIYSVLAFAVSQRTNEFGIRLALGAQSRHLVLNVLGQGVVLTSVGMGAGIALALVALKACAALIPGLRAGDPFIFAGSTMVLGAVGLLASYLPARRATRVDPVRALRNE